MPGTLAVPEVFVATPAPTTPFARLDLNFTTVTSYVNDREITYGLLANRAAAGVSGRYYWASDVQGGTLYGDDGVQWNQLSPGVTVQAPQNTVIILASYHLACL